VDRLGRAVEIALLAQGDKEREVAEAKAADQMRQQRH